MVGIGKNRELINSLEDLIPLSRWAEPSIRIVREYMKFDPGHDERHLLRVTRDAMRFGVMTDNDGIVYRADPDVIIPACI